MKKDFNDTGTCVANMHYMVDTSEKINKILSLVERRKYFTINRPRQFGKTTTISKLYMLLQDMPEYLVIRTSFEGIGDSVFEDEKRISQGVLELFTKLLKVKEPELYQLIEQKISNVKNFNTLSVAITQIVQSTPRKIVVIIDEVDKSSNNQLFLSFLGMLRDKYLLQNEGADSSFYSVILAGVHDIKTLKLSPESRGKLNSPWNIAVDFKVDLSFNPQEIGTMLQSYSEETGIEMDIPEIAERLYFYTSGYPYLVSKMCKFIDEDILPETKAKRWELSDVEKSFKMITYPGYTTTLFDDLFKNLENNRPLYDFIFDISITGKLISYSVNNTTLNLAIVYGILKDENGYCAIHNRVFEQRIYNFYVTDQIIKSRTEIGLSYQFTDGHQIDFCLLLQRFQQFMKENYAKKDIKFLEREGRLVFMSFLKPTINGKGHDFKEPVVGDERRTDIVITYGTNKYVVELKIWRGDVYHQKGLQQLSDYLDIYSLKKGYLLIFDFNKNKTYKEETIQFGDKEIFAVWV